MNYPMTAFEIWKYLLITDANQEGVKRKKVRLREIVECLEGKNLKDKIEQDQGFYFLSGRKNLVGQRIEKNKLSEQKFKIIRRVIFWLRFLPYVRMVAVTGTVAMKNAAPGSDLDFLIVFKNGRIFFGRTLVTALVHLMGKRRYGKKIADRVCLNCFITDASLESRQKDLFSSSEYSHIVALFGQEVFNQFQKQNHWMEKFRADFNPGTVPNLKALPEGGLSRIFRESAEKIFNGRLFDRLERRLEKWQTERIAKDPRTWEQGSVIVANPQALIFFHRARAPFVDKTFQARLKGIVN